LQKTIASTLSGVVWVWLAMTLIGMMNMGSYAWVIIGIVAFILVIQSKLPALSFIPGAFCGAAVTAWAAPADPKGYLMVAVALVAGIRNRLSRNARAGTMMGYISAEPRLPWLFRYADVVMIGTSPPPHPLPM